MKTCSHHILVVAKSRISPAAEVRERFKRVKPLKEIGVKERGWTLDVLNIVRRLVEERGVHAASSSKSSATLKRTEVRAPSEFSTSDAYVFTRELEKLDPDSPGYGAASRDVRLYFPPTTLIWSGDSRMISGRLRYSVILPVISTC